MPLKDKHVCPNCGYDYEPWVEVCPDCDRELIWRSTEEQKPWDFSSGPQWVIAGNAPNAILASFLKTQLEAAGIPVVLMRSRGADIAQFSHNDYVAQDIRVPSDRLQEARAIIDADPDVPPADFVGPGSTTLPSNLPPGWTLLSSDLSPHGTSSLTGNQAGVEHEDRYENEEDYIKPEDDGRASHAPGQGYGAYGDSSWDRRNWVKIVYGILLAAMSLPFFLQIIQQFGSIFGRHP